MTDSTPRSSKDVPSPKLAPETAFMRAPFYRYHCFTKHTVAQMMSNAWFLDWDNQPDPFRRYEGAPLVRLPRDFTVSGEDSFDVIYRSQVAGDRGPSEPVAALAGLSMVSNLFFYSLAVSAWKEIRGTEHRWPLRVNPSSGNLHPTEAHLLCRGVPDLPDGAYHYAPREHLLERRATGDSLGALWGIIAGDDEPAPTLLVVLTSVFWREAWKYRHRAYRYCNHDAGHAAAAVLVSAAALGWRGELRGRFPDVEVERVLGIIGSDERPLVIVPLRPSGPSVTPPTLRESMPPSSFCGVPNALSAEVIPYETIEDVHLAGVSSSAGALPRLPSTASRAAFSSSIAADLEIPGPTARAGLGVARPIHFVVRRRRSAVDHDGVATMSIAELMLVLSSATRGVPADFLRGVESDAHFLIHLYAYIHRVRDLQAGLYRYDRVQQSLKPLRLEDQRNAASGLSLGQDIASAACFALSMVADLETAYALHGDRGYRFVHHEAGAIGQLLYLAADALDFQATGIGAFFDDDVNRHLGLPTGFEVVYHFCVGHAVDDARLSTRPAYDFADPALPS